MIIVYPSEKKRMTNVDIMTYVCGLTESVFVHEY